jgi:hypothetical protein
MANHHGGGRATSGATIVIAASALLASVLARADRRCVATLLSPWRQVHLGVSLEPQGRHA